MSKKLTAHQPTPLDNHIEKRASLQTLAKQVCWKCAKGHSLFYPRNNKTPGPDREQHYFHHEGVTCEAAGIYLSGYQAGIEVWGNNHPVPGKK